MKIKYILLISLFIACKNNESENTETIDSTNIYSMAVQSSSSQNEIIFEPTQLLGIKIGDELEQLTKTMPKKVVKSILHTGDGDFDVYDVLDENGQKIAHLFPDPISERKVDAIVVVSDKIKTKAGIRVGSTFGDLVTLYGEIKVTGSEIEGWTHANGKDFSYKLDTNFWQMEVDEAKIKATTKIKEITAPAFNFD